MVRRDIFSEPFVNLNAPVFLGGNAVFSMTLVDGHIGVALLRKPNSERDTPQAQMRLSVKIYKNDSCPRLLRLP